MHVEITGCNDCPFFHMAVNDDDYFTFCKHPNHKTITNKDIDVKLFLTPITPQWCYMNNEEYVVTKNSILT